MPSPRPHIRSLRFAERFPNWRFAFVAAAIVGTLGAVTLTAVQLERAWRERREAMEYTLGGYVQAAARQFAAEVSVWAGDHRMRMLAPVMSVSVPPGGTPMPLADFAKRAERMVVLSGLQIDPSQGYFRLGLAHDSLETLGLADGAALHDTLRAVVAARLPDLHPMDEPALAYIDNQRTSVAFARQLDDAGHPVAVFGVVFPRRHSIEQVARPVFERAALLPPAIASLDWTGGTIRVKRPLSHAPRALTDTILPTVAPRNDTLLSVRMTDHNGVVLYQSPLQFTSGIRGRVELHTRPGGYAVEATLRPDVAARLLALRMPGEQRWLLLALLAVAGAAGLAAIVQLRRERELVQARRQFVSSVSHELRTPLAQIRLFAETILLGRSTEEQRERWMRVIGREARHLGDMVENIVLFAAAEGRGVRFAPVWTDVSELVTSTLTGYAPLAAARSAIVSSEIAAGVHANVDPGALRQVLVNLLDNALKYGPTGQTIAVTLASLGGGDLRLTVSDEGPGIPPRDRERIWRPFERLTDRGGATGGSGLGLAVVRDLARLHGGQAWIEEAPGGGAKFVVVLPVGIRAAASTPAHGVMPGAAVRGARGEERGAARAEAEG